MGRQATFQNFPMRVRGFVDGWMDGWGGTAGVRSLLLAGGERPLSRMSSGSRRARKETRQAFRVLGPRGNGSGTDCNEAKSGELDRG